MRPIEFGKQDEWQKVIAIMTMADRTQSISLVTLYTQRAVPNYVCRLCAGIRRKKE